LDRRPESGRRGAALNGGALASVALGSAIQVALYLRDFGATHRTDGVIAAIAVYSLVVTLGQLLRTTAVPLLTGASPQLSGERFGWGLGAIAAAVSIVCVALSAVIAAAVAGATGPVGRNLAGEALVIMGPAIGLQLLGSGLAVEGAIRGRLDAVSVAFMVSSIAGLAGYFALRAASAELVLAWANLIGSAALVAALAMTVRPPLRRPPGPRRLVSGIAALARSVPLPASFVVMYPLTLALAPHDRPGQITLFGLAFTACSYLAGFTGQALSMSDAVTLARLPAADAPGRRELVLRAFRYSLLLAAPGLGAAAVAGGPLVRALLPADSSGTNAYFAIDLLLLIPWLMATLGVWATLPALLSDRRRPDGRRLAEAVAALLAVHVIAALVGRAVWGFDGLVAGMAIAPAAFTAVAVAVTVPSAAAGLLRPAALVLAAAGIGFGAGELAARSAGSPGPGTGIAGAALGIVIYAALAATAFPHTARVLVRIIVRR
jgi:hypothetical protein